mmetsp:Transcript_7413/g.18870  ORF Transcript_7413/g.18870 Transcript_7413/m.18870 type:complete len:604 (-) Transcript_7413:163-1974(-)
MYYVVHNHLTHLQPRRAGVHAHGGAVVQRVVEGVRGRGGGHPALARGAGVPPALQPVVAQCVARRARPRVGAGDGEVHPKALEDLGDAQEDVVPQPHGGVALLPQRAVLVVAHHLQHGAPGEGVDPRERAARRQAHPPRQVRARGAPQERLDARLDLRHVPQVLEGDGQLLAELAVGRAAEVLHLVRHHGAVGDVRHLAGAVDELGVQQPDVLHAPADLAPPRQQHAHHLLGAEPPGPHHDDPPEVVGHGVAQHHRRQDTQHHGGRPQALDHPLQRQAQGVQAGQQREAPHQHARLAVVHVRGDQVRRLHLAVDALPQLPGEARQVPLAERVEEVAVEHDAQQAHAALGREQLVRALGADGHDHDVRPRQAHHEQRRAQDLVHEAVERVGELLALRRLLAPQPVPRVVQHHQRRPQRPHQHHEAEREARTVQHRLRKGEPRGLLQHHGDGVAHQRREGLHAHYRAGHTGRGGVAAPARPPPPPLPAPTLRAAAVAVGGGYSYKPLLLLLLLLVLLVHSAHSENGGAPQRSPGDATAQGRGGGGGGGGGGARRAPGGSGGGGAGGARGKHTPGGRRRGANGLHDVVTVKDVLVTLILSLGDELF